MGSHKLEVGRGRDLKEEETGTRSVEGMGENGSRGGRDPSLRKEEGSDQKRDRNSDSR